MSSAAHKPLLDQARAFWSAPVAQPPAVEDVGDGREHLLPGDYPVIAIVHGPRAGGMHVEA